MNNVLTSLCGTVNWIPLGIAIGVFATVVLLIVICACKKGISRALLKYLLIALGIVAAIAGLAIFFILVVPWGDTMQTIDFAVRWLPTVLFVLIVLIATLFGIWRGLRKSLIYAVHAVVAGIFSVSFFFIMVSVKEVDAGMLNFLNFFAGGEGALQRALGVPESCSTLKEVLANVIPLIVGTESEIGIILAENAAYVYTLVDMAYRIIIAALAFLIHIGLEFTLFIVYHFAYSQRKYKKNRILEFQNGTSDRNYRPHRIGGGVVGLVRGAAIGLLSMSFLGSVFFIAAGGKGDGKLSDYDYDFGDKNANYIFDIYRSIEGYGAQGIFSILNSMSDAADTPYYLFAADLIFSGEVNDEEAGYSDNVVFREELATYTGFARDTMELLMKYGGEELNGIVGGEVTDGSFDTVVSVMAKPEFRFEFNALIDEFDAQTYIINLSMSLVNSVVSNIDEMSFIDVGEREKDLLKVIFKKGYLSENIPDERALIEATGTNEASGESIRPCLTVNHLLTKSDVKNVLNVALSLIAEGTDDTFNTVKSVIPEIGKLSILQSDRKAEFNPVLGRMYCLFENEYLTLEGEKGVTYNEITTDGVDWIEEINILLDLSADSITLYNNAFTGDKEPLDIITSLFDEADAHYEENMRIYDKLRSSLSDSRVLGRVLSTGYMYNTLTEALYALSENVYIPRDISYNNVYDKEGNLISHGELYNLLSGLKIIGGECAELMEKLADMDTETQQEEILKLLKEALDAGDENYKLSHYLVESEILRSALSVSLIETKGNTFYVPRIAREVVDGEIVPLIKKPILEDLLENMTDLVDFVMPFVDGSDWQGEVDKLLKDLGDLVKQNVIFEGTVAQILNGKLLKDVLVIPKALEGDVEAWLSVDGKDGELITLLNSMQVSGFDINGILVGGEAGSADILDSIVNMTEEELDTFFSSSVILYTVSKYLIDDSEGIEGFDIIVPVNSREFLTDDVLKSVVKKNALVCAFGEISKLGLLGEEEFDISSMLTKIAQDKDILRRSEIVTASFAATLVKEDKTGGLLGIPEALSDTGYGSKTELEQLDRNNPWSTELLSLVNALDEIFGLSDPENDTVIDSGSIAAEISAILIKLNSAPEYVEGYETKLAVLYDSLIVRNKITEELDNKFTPDVVPEYVVSYVKLGGYYTYEELSALCDAANALGFADADGFDPEAFKDISEFNKPVDGSEDTLLHIVYRSDIVAGIITKNVREIIVKNAQLSDHPKAYRTALKVYEEREIECLVEIYENLGEIVNLDLEKVGGYILDDDGVTGSYILVASLSGQLLTNKGLIIPHTVMQGGYIAPTELKNFVAAFNALKNTGSYDFENIGGFDENTRLVIPDADTRKVLFESEIIRARITWQLNTLNTGDAKGILAVGDGEGAVVIDQRGKEYAGVGRTATVSAAQLEALAAALEVMQGEGAKFEVPAIDIDGLRDLGLDDIETVLNSDILRYRVCKELSVASGTEKVFYIDSLATAELQTASKEEIKQALGL